MRVVVYRAGAEQFLALNVGYAYTVDAVIHGIELRDVAANVRPCVERKRYFQRTAYRHGVIGKPPAVKVVADGDLDARRR